MSHGEEGDGLAELRLMLWSMALRVARDEPPPQSSRRSIAPSGQESAALRASSTWSAGTSMT